MKHSLLMPVFLCLFITFIQGQNPYFPDKNWESKKPNEVKMNPILLDSAVNFALKNEVKMEYDLRIANMKSYAREPDYKILGPMKDRGKPTGIILKNGYIVAQWGDLERVDMTFSVTKSYLSTIAGLAVDNGLIENIDTVVKKHVWDDTYAGTQWGCHLAAFADAIFGLVGLPF
jgi:hypothetical protein